MSLRARSGRKRRRPAVEGLESRRLLTVSISDITLQPRHAQVTGVAAYPNGNIWFTIQSPSVIGVDQPLSGQFVGLDYRRSSRSAWPSWGSPSARTETSTSPTRAERDRRLQPGDAQVRRVSDPHGQQRRPTSIAVANDGTVWFTEYLVGKIGEYDPATKTITEYPSSGTGTNPKDIQLGPDGSLWFLESGAFASINPTTKAIATIPFNPSGAPRAGRRIQLHVRRGHPLRGRRPRYSNGNGLYAAATLFRPAASTRSRRNTVSF